MGISIPKFIIENVSLPPEVEEAMDRRTQMGVIGDLGRYTQFQAANAMEDAANNPGGAGDALGLGLGVGLGQRAAAAMGTPMTAPATQTAPAGPPPLPVEAAWYIGVDGSQLGPLAAGDLAAHVANGKLTNSTLVWRAGMGEWTAAASVPEIARLIPQAPPPLPPQG
jgi:hypothetical protein